MGVRSAASPDVAAPTSGGELLAMWTGVVAPPLIFLAHLELAYILVPLACDHGSLLVAHATMSVAIALSVAAGLLALRPLRRHGRAWPDESASLLSRDRFLGVLGGLVSALVVIALIAQWLPMFFLSPCRGV